MAFIGQAEVVIDAKARLAVPAKFRDAMPRDAMPRDATPRDATPRDASSRDATPSAAAVPPSSGETEDTPRGVWVSTPRADGTIWLFPEQTFLNLAAALEHSLSPEEDETEHNRILFGLSERVTMDGAHRLTLPRKHLDRTGLSGEVTVVGALNHLEIHPREQWEAREAERLAKLPALAAKLRQQRRP